MIEGAKCPECGSNLDAVPKLGLVTYECPAGHGVGINILEESSDLQPDELDAIWQGVKDAPQSTLLSPITGKPMATVTFMADDDTEVGNSGTNARKLTIEVDVEKYFGWFSFEELRDMPLNATKGGPAARGFVDMATLDRSDGMNDRIFENLKPEDYENGDWKSTAGDSLNGLFRGIAHRIRD